MVKFFVSYRSGDEPAVAALVADALAARFGQGSVFLDSRSLHTGADFRPALWAALSHSDMLIVVIGQRWLSGTGTDGRRRIDDQEDFVRREIEFALERDVPILPVVSGDVDFPRLEDLPGSLSGLVSRQYLRIRMRTAADDLRQIIESLTATVDSGARAAARTSPATRIPLLLSEEPLMTIPIRPTPGRAPSVAMVYATRDGELEVLDGGRPLRWSEALSSRYRRRYEVDIGDHHLALSFIDDPLPSRDDTYHFIASLTVGFRVTDPAQIVRRNVGDAAPLVRSHMSAVCRAITRQFAVHETEQAEQAIHARFEQDNLIDGGITIYAVHCRLSVDEGGRRYLQELGESRREQRIRDVREPGLVNDAAREAELALLRQTAEQHLSERERLLRLHLERNPQDVEGAMRLLAELETNEELSDRGRYADAFRSVVEGSTGATTPAPGAGKYQPQRLLVARAPAQVPQGEELSLDVRVVTEGRILPPRAAASPMSNLNVSDTGTPVIVTVHATPGLQNVGPLQQSMLLLPAEDPQPVRFAFSAYRPGLHRIDVTAWAGGTFLAEVSVEVSVAANAAFRDGQPRTAPLAATQSRPGEVTLEVRFDGSHYTFQLRSDAALFAPVVESVTNQPGTAVENAIKELQQLAGGRSRYSPAMTREVIRSAGIELWTEMVPNDIQDQFWQVGSQMSAFTIATDYDVIPWELMYPLNAEHDAGFLVEQVPVVRRTYGQHRSSRVSLGDARFVVSAKEPTGAKQEISAIRAILGAAETAPITTADELLALVNSGSMGALHFACHNTFSSDGSFIDMDGGRFKPGLLAEANIRQLLAETGPLVFINACRSAGAAPTYTRMLGWAQQFMSSGAGAFIGTLWAVRTDSSARFATAFYESLAHGATLGAAALAARTTQQQDPLDPTWLAYTVYGDPFATAR
jgi:hypothetical protein